jgi:type VI secretion system secreted protein VgrG
VRLFWDIMPRERRPLSSLPIRMLQPHAGPHYGMHFPLKPGVEVMVGFVEGDPDRPVIVGAVPNPITPSPVTQANAIMNRIETTSGVFLEIRDI